MGVVSLPAWFVFRLNGDDPPPMPWGACEAQLRSATRSTPTPSSASSQRCGHILYPPSALDAGRRTLIATLEATAPLVEVLVSHRAPSLGGRAPEEVLPLTERRPAKLTAHYRR